MKNPGTRHAPPAGQEEYLTGYTGEDSRVRVGVQIPGISETRIRVDLDDRVLVISASDGGKEYWMEIILPWTSRIARKKFRDGVLELIVETTASDR